MFLQQCHSLCNNGTTYWSRCSGFCWKLILLYQSTFAPYTYLHAHMLYSYDIHYTDIHILLLVYNIYVLYPKHNERSCSPLSPPFRLEKGRSSLSDGYYNITSLSAAREYIMHIHIKYIMTVRAYFVNTCVKVIYSS